jgi:hypothetical protein
MNLIDKYLGINEDSTEDAKKTLEAIIGALKKAEGKDATEMKTQADGTMEYFKKNGSFSPAQAKWIYNTSKALFK